jgi:GDP-L-fucose synthase
MKIVLFGGSGLIGSSLKRVLSPKEVVIAPSRSELDLNDHRDVSHYLNAIKPDAVINAAGAVAGIQGNINHPSRLILDNADISINIIKACLKTNVTTYLQFASACVYPIQEFRPSVVADIGTGPIEGTSRSYAYAKILAIEAVSAVRNEYGLNWTTLIPSNIYGPFDWKHGNDGHLLSMLTSRFLEAKQNGATEVEVWGDGLSKRNLLHVEDLAQAVICLLDSPGEWDAVYNICGDEECTVREISEIVKQKSKFDGKLTFDNTRPNGARRKILDDTRIRALGWKPTINLDEGIEKYVLDFMNSI